MEFTIKLEVIETKKVQFAHFLVMWAGGGSILIGSRGGRY